MTPEPMDRATLQAAVKNAIEAAVSFVESEVAEDRIEAQKYFNGQVKLEADEERSQVVATKCRDTVRMIEPVLMRTFLASGKPVEFVPKGPEDIEQAEQATEYVNWRFNENGGFGVLASVFRDALVKKTGIAKVYWDESECVEFEEYSNQPPEAVQLIAQEMEIIDAQQNEMGLFDVKAAKTTTEGKLKVMALAPEDFFVDAGATCIDDAFVCGDRAEMRVGDVVAMGFPFEAVIEHAGDYESALAEEEDIARRGWDDEYDTDSVNDPSMRKIQVTEAYLKVDAEGTGIPRLYQFLCLGGNYRIINVEPADEIPYAVFEVDPEPHAFHGHSVVDIVKNDQDAATSLLRGMIDNMHSANNARYAFDENRVEEADMMNNEHGGLVRVQGDPGSAIFPMATPNSAQGILPAIQYYDQVIDGKTGVSRASLGMDGEALQGRTVAGVNAAVQAASAAVELMARHLAEGGMRRLFRVMLRLTHKHASPNEMMRLNGRFVPVDPRSWNTSMDVVANIGLGTGQKEIKQQALLQVYQDQQQIMAQFGPGNPFVSFAQMYNTRADLLELSNIHSVTRYYNPVGPEIDQMLAQQQQAQQQQPQGDPNAAFLQAEQMKVSARAQADMAETQRKAQADMMKDDRERDKMEQDAILDAAEMVAKHAAQPDPGLTAPIRQMQGVPRQ